MAEFPQLLNPFPNLLGPRASSSSSSSFSQVLDMTPDHKVYKKANNKLNNAIEGAYYNVAISHIGTSYMLPTLVEFLEGKAPSGKPNPVTRWVPLRRKTFSCPPSLPVHLFVETPFSRSCPLC
jgi:hypothetical protein